MGKYDLEVFFHVMFIWHIWLSICTFCSFFKVELKRTTLVFSDSLCWNTWIISHIHPSIILSILLYLCYTCSCYVRDPRCNPKGANHSAVSTTFSFIIQLDSDLVPFFVDNPPTSWSQSITFNATSPWHQIRAMWTSSICTAVYWFTGSPPIFHKQLSQEEARRNIISVTQGPQPVCNWRSRQWQLSEDTQV